MPDDDSQPVVAHGSSILPADSPDLQRQRLARIALDAMVQFVWLLDTEGTVLDVNQVALNAAGTTLAEVAGKTLGTTRWWQVSEPVRQQLGSAIQRAAAGESVRWDSQVFGRAAGTELLVIDASLTPVRDHDGKVVFLCAEGRDIPERSPRHTPKARAKTARAREHQARLDAELKNNLLHSLFKTAPMLMLVLRGPRHEVELANPPVCAVFSRSESELLGRALFDVLPELRDQGFMALLDGVYESGVRYLGSETPASFLRDDGSLETSYFTFVYAPNRSAAGVIEGVFVIATDVTEQVRTREQIDGLRASAEGANRAKDEFLAMLGHELRNPLSPIVTALQLMKGQDAAGAERARTVIERQVSHLVRLVDDLLDVSRIARGKVELKKETVEIAEVISEAIETVSPLLEQRAHVLRVEVPRHGLSVEGDPSRLSQVVTNLLTNAAKYTPHAGTITVRARRDNDQLVLSVRDTGIGISPEVLPHVFDLFVQERQAIDRSLGGLGLGLSIVQNLVESHGGSVSAASGGAGSGSEFIVQLPLASPVLASAPPRAELATEPTAPGQRARRVLVVDDNEDGAAMLALALERQGYLVRVANDGPEALEAASEFLPDIALLDIGLPVMDGYELAVRLRELPALSHVRLIALTGYGQESDRQRSQQAGFDQHLVKPVTITVLGEVMRQF